MDTNKVCQLIADYDADLIVASAARLVGEKLLKCSDPLTSPSLVRAYLKFALSLKEREEFHVLYLNSQHEVIAFVTESIGTLDAASVYPREIAKSALNHNAAAVILAHNHPSGTPEPSEADKRITKRLVEALKLLDIRVLDHLIVGGDSIISFAERGLISP